MGERSGMENEACQVQQSTKAHEPYMSVPANPSSTKADEATGSRLCSSSCAYVKQSIREYFLEFSSTLQSTWCRQHSGCLAAPRPCGHIATIQNDLCVLRGVAWSARNGD